ncbi:GlxA family transcriptional regulator [Hyphomicrobium sp.]|uniref:GlxA family transcriptional regulator n=1 Tax=Hyphomicrobium sp. TaxID=82 RepID=UPI000FBEAFB9|nr:GlxA family transcriptional regulator [Hyphomicrobium sp.]RUP00389.1 MAG: GlxA family transcriptional regulator [Hyphomicrobium sp.]
MRIGFLVYPNCSVMGLAVSSVFEIANVVRGEKAYDIQFLSEKGGPIKTSAGLVFQTQRISGGSIDTLVVDGANDPKPSSPQIISYLKAAERRCRRVAASCTGAFVLGQAGLLDGKRVTTHWLFARTLQEMHPTAHVDDDRIFINDGKIWTSAGMSAGIDLALALVEADFGIDTARSVAKKLVLYHRRSGGQSQFSELLELGPKSDRIQTALDYAKRNLHRPLTVAKLAEAAHLSPRQFSRAFREETGQSPAKAVEAMRVEAARILMEQTRHPIDVIARQTGFADRSRMRRAFIRILGQPPQAIRRNARLETRELRNAEGAKPRLRSPREARKRTTREPIPA